MTESPFLRLDEITVGMTATFETDISQKTVSAFADFSGDHNPLHTDAAYASNTPFKAPIPHGMIAGALFSRLIGMYLPGRNAAYIAQTLRFHKPLPYQTIMIRGEITEVSAATRSAKVATSVHDANGELLVDGEARVRFFS